MVRGWRRSEDAAEVLVPSVVAESGLGFLADGGKRLHEQLGDISEGRGFASGDTAAGQGGEKFSEGVIDVGGAIEFAGKGSEVATEFDFGEGFALFAGVGVTERIVRGRARHAAAAAVGEGELAEGRIVSQRAFDGHVVLEGIGLGTG